MVLSFKFSGPNIRFHGRILADTLGLVLVALFLSRRLAVIFLEKLFGVIFWVMLVVVKLYLDAIISGIQLFGCGTSGSPSLSFQERMFGLCTSRR